MNQEVQENIEATDTEQFGELLSNLLEETRNNHNKVEALFAKFEAMQGHNGGNSDSCHESETDCHPDQAQDTGDDDLQAEPVDWSRIRIADDDDDPSIYSQLAVLLGLGVAGYGLYRALR